jgi:outer membrane protein assembly factor BamB
MRRWWLISWLILAPAVPAGTQTIPDPSEAPLWHTAARGRGVPAVRGDRVFALTSHHDLVALALDDGRELWRRSTHERGTFTEGTRVLVSGDTVIAGDWDIYAFHADTGEAAWNFHPGEGYGPGMFLGAVSSGRVFSGSPAGALYAVDAATGRQVWRAVVEPVTNDKLTTVFAPVVNDALVVAGYTQFGAPDRGGLIAVDAGTGRERWRFRFPSRPDDLRGVYWAGGIALTTDLAIGAASDGTIWAVDLATGTSRWSIPPLEGPFDGIIRSAVLELRGLAVAGDRLIVGSLTGYLTAYDLSTRREIWRVEKGWLGSLSWSTYTVADGVAYVPWWSGFLLAIDVKTGLVLWETQNHQLGLSAPPAVAGERVIAAGSSGFWAFPAARVPESQPSTARPTGGLIPNKECLRCDGPQ